MVWDDSSMRIELEPDDIETIAQRVLELMQPHLISEKNRIQTKDPCPPEGEFLNTKQVAQYLKVSLATIRLWTYQRRIPFVKLGRRILFKRSEIELWVDNRKVKASYDERIRRSR
jgi:excisionase family DNA binding protein